MIRFLLLLTVFLSFFHESGRTQPRRNRKPKISFSKGTFYAYYGYNRAWYGKSTLNLTGTGYAIQLEGFRAQDAPFRPSLSQQLNPLRSTTGQYSVRAGYYFLNHYSISFGFDKLKYLMADRQIVQLNGLLSPNIDPANNWIGTYENESKELNANTFFYGNSGLNNLHLDFSRTDNWLAAGRSQQFVFSTVEGIGLGGLISDNSFLFGNIQEKKLRSFSGVAFSAHVGLRLEFFKHLFIQSNLSGGLMSQIKVSTRASEPDAFADQRFGFLQFDTNLGCLFYIRHTNNCNTCPTWK